MRRVLNFFVAIFHGIGWVVGLIRDGESDVAETYPDRPGPTGEQSATQGSVTMSLTGLGTGM